MIDLPWSYEDRRMIYRRGLTIRGVAAGIFGVAFTVVWASPVGAEIPALGGLLAILVGLVAINPLLWMIGENRGFPLRDFRWHWAGDVSAVTGIVYCLGVLDVPLSVTAYMIMIVSSGTFSSMRTALYLATWSALGFVVIVVADSTGVIPHQHVAFAAHFDPGGSFVMVGVSILLFYVFGYLGGTLAAQLREKAVEVLRQKSELEEAYERQAEASRTMELLSALVQHDVYGPLGAISGACREASEACSSGNVESARHFIGMIGDRLRSVEGAVSTLGLLARAEIADGFEGFPLNDVIDQLREDLRVDCIDRRVDLVACGSDGWPFVNLRREELYHVLRNLVTNGIKAVAEDGNGTVGITIKRANEGCEVVVEDNGRGISEDLVAQVLGSSLRRLGERRPGGGFGAGLALSNNLARSWGGSITYRRGRKGGAAFTVTIPAAKIDAWQQA